MAKLSIEIDTEGKTVKCMLDGKEVQPFSCNLGRYTYYNEDDGNKKKIEYAYGSYTMEKEDGSRYGYTIEFDLGSKSAFIQESTIVAEEMTDSVIAGMKKAKMHAGKEALKKALSKKKAC